MSNISAPSRYAEPVNGLEFTKFCRASLLRVVESEFKILYISEPSYRVRLVEFRESCILAGTLENEEFEVSAISWSR